MDDFSAVAKEELEGKRPLNYFSYFTEIEETFVRRRGKHLFIGTFDWALIETWKQIGIPLHVALRGIEKAFDSWESKPRKRSVNSLLYCQEEVEAQLTDPAIGADMGAFGRVLAQQAAILDKHAELGGPRDVA